MEQGHCEWNGTKNVFISGMALEWNRNLEWNNNPPWNIVQIGRAHV